MWLVITWLSGVYKGKPGIMTKELLSENDVPKRLYVDVCSVRSSHGRRSFSLEVVKTIKAWIGMDNY